MLAYSYSLFLSHSHCVIREITVCHPLKTKQKQTNISMTQQNMQTKTKKKRNMKAFRECWLIAYSLFPTLAPFKNREITVCHPLKRNKQNRSITKHKHNNTYYRECWLIAYSFRECWRIAIRECFIDNVGL